MKREQIKKILAAIANIALLGFGIVFIATKFFSVEIKDAQDLQSLLVVIYLVFKLIFFTMDSKDKEKRIHELERQLKEKSL